MLAALAVVVFLPAIPAGFVNWDDDILVVDNEILRAPGGLGRIWSTVQLPDHYPNYPLVFSSYWLEYRLWGLEARGYHATNVLLHGVNTALIFLLLRALTLTPWTAAVAAAMFAVHPMQVESVAWVAERKNLLSSLFFLAAFLAYLRHRAAGRWSWYGLALIAFAGALLSKTAAVVLPVVLLITDRLRVGRWTSSSLWRVLPMVALGLLAGAVSLGVENHPPTVSVLVRPLLAAACLWFYVGKLLVPIGLSPIYPLWPVAASQVRWWLPLAAAVAAAIVIASARRDWRIRWGVVFFVCLLAPVLGVRSFGLNEYSFVADRYVYLACVGLFAVLALALERAHARAGRVATLAVSAWILLLVGITWHRIPVWRSSVTLWTRVLADEPRSPLARNNLGMALVELGRHAEAAQEFEAGLALAPDDPDLHNNLALVLYRMGNAAAAEAQSRQAVALRPADAGLHKNLALTLRAQGRLDEAEASLRRALALQPDPLFRYLLATVLVSEGRRSEASVELERVLMERPDFAPARQALAELHDSAEPVQ